MKKIFMVLFLGSLFGCGGNESSDSKQTDLDRTKNNDTSVNTKQIPDSVQKNSDTSRKGRSDTTHL